LNPIYGVEKARQRNSRTVSRIFSGVHARSSSVVAGPIGEGSINVFVKQDTPFRGVRNKISKSSVIEAKDG
jgi:hypothetical protein